MVERASRVAATLFLVAAPGVVSAVEPVAIVQSVEASGTSVRAMELIERGRVFELGAKGRLVLGYFRSCLHEEITGRHCRRPGEPGRRWPRGTSAGRV